MDGIDTASREAPVPRQSHRRIPRWAWPACMVVAAVGALGLSWCLQPSGDQVSFLGQPLDQPCPFLMETGDPCPNCGFTRAVMWTGRGQPWRAVRHHPAGTAVMVWLLFGGTVGARRLLGRQHDAWKTPWPLLVGWALLCMVGLYVGTWVARLLV